MTDEERRTVTVTAIVLLLASVVRFAWEVRPLPPVLPPQELSEELLEGTREAVALEERRRTPLAPGERIDLNRDSEVELARLPGVGPALAERVVSAREDAPFTSPDDLLRVPGIGPATLERIRAHIEVGDPVEGAPAPSLGGLRRETGRQAAWEAGGIPVNRASESELEALPGIGPALASRIVQWRREHGPFSSPEALLEVPGIGPATLDRIRELLAPFP